MSPVPFTPITDGLDVQSVAFVNEYVDSFNERRKALDPNFPDANLISQVVAGTDIQKSISVGADFTSFGWNQVQHRLEAEVVANYVDHTQPITGATAVPFFTLATWRAAAGMNASGFRRATAWNPAVDDATDINDPMFSFGEMQAGDIIGPWIYTDLQNGISALKKTHENSAPSSVSSIGNQVTTGNCPSARSAQISTWPGAFSAGGAVRYRALASLRTGGTAQGQREKGKATTTNIPTFIAHVGDAYIQPVKDSPTDIFQDVDGLGFVESVIKFEENFTSAAVSSRTTTNEIGNFTTNPMTDFPATCAESPVTKSASLISFLILTWDFARSN